MQRIQSRDLHDRLLFCHGASMLPTFDLSLAGKYKSVPQRIRVMSESWVAKHVSCPFCGDELIPFGTGFVGLDFFCNRCDEEFQLKSMCGGIPKKLTGAEYQKTKEAFDSGQQPNLLCLVYQKPNYEITRLVLIRRHLLTSKILKARKRLLATARRAGWQGCYWQIDQIPTEHWEELIS